MRGFLVIVLIMFGIHSVAHAQGTPISMFSNPTGWAVASNTVFGSNGLPLAYDAAYDTATSTAANYVLTEELSNQVFGASSYATQGNTQTWSETTQPIGWVTNNVSFSSGVYNINVAENSVGLPCTRNGGAAEYDIYMGPNTYDMGINVASAINPAYKLHPEYVPSLNKMASLTVTGQAIINSVSQPVTPTACSVNHGDVLFTYNIVNRSMNQIISYGLTLGRLCLPGPDYVSCTYEATKTAVVWYRDSQGFAVTDSPTAYGSGITIVPNGGAPTALPLSGPGTVTLTSLNLLPRIETLIQTNPEGLDKNISHWQVGAPLYGTNIWGDSAMTTTWYGLNPAASCIRPNCS